MAWGITSSVTASWIKSTKIPSSAWCRYGARRSPTSTASKVSPLFTTAPCTPPTHAGSDGKGLFDLAAGRFVQARWCLDVDHRFVRSRTRSLLLGHQQRRPVDLESASRRQPVGGFGDCDSSEDRRNRVALSMD